MGFARSLLALCALCVSGEQLGVSTVLVTGATGRTGSLTYLMLKEKGYEVVGLVRNTTKARERIGCNKCDESEGIFVGDIRDPSTLDKPFQKAQGVVILTSSAPVPLGNGSYYYPNGSYPIDIDWKGSNNQVRMAMKYGLKHILLVSSAGTSMPDSTLDMLGHGHVLFYKLNAEASLMASGVPFTVVKPMGLSDHQGGESKLVSAQEDILQFYTVARQDVANVLVNALEMPQLSKGLRFDLASDPSKPASGNFQAFFEDIRENRL
ncbi:hypothetical protein AAMO2058_001534400 [Amorphochlora amoebiformis]|mmetsp:Transcript_26311/g.41618  ORF Transcript_26311/g.41618 Transcript_26311/m.41618 type:complete len:265 (-) Transcript_26311:167-961(-)